jgi:hypothetical protein
MVIVMLTVFAGAAHICLYTAYCDKIYENIPSRCHGPKALPDCMQRRASYFPAFSLVRSWAVGSKITTERGKSAKQIWGRMRRIFVEPVDTPNEARCVLILATLAVDVSLPSAKSFGSRTGKVIGLGGLLLSARNKKYLDANARVSAIAKE